MNYTLHQLRIFLKIAKTGSVTKASEELHLTQPAVSIQLKNFQDQFDVALTEVVGRKIYITEFGKQVAESAEKILIEADAFERLSKAQGGQLTGRLVISSVSTGKYVMPYFLTDFMKQHPGVELIMDVTNKQKVVESLERNEVDFALVSILPDHLQVHTIDLLLNKLYLVGIDRPKLKNANSLRTLFDETPLIFRERGSGTRQVMERFIQRHHLTVAKKLELTSNEAVKQAVLAGLGYSIMPIIGIRNEVKNKSIRIIPVKGLPIKTMWQLIWLKGKNLSPVATAYLDYIRQEKRAIATRYFAQLDHY